MQKPIVVAYDEFKEKIVATVNEHIKDLPIVFMADFLGGLSKNLESGATTQLDNARNGVALREEDETDA